jgi:hypothetical protein
LASIVAWNIGGEKPPKICSLLKVGKLSLNEIDREYATASLAHDGLTGVEELLSTMPARVTVRAAWETNGQVILGELQAARSAPVS